MNKRMKGEQDTSGAFDLDAFVQGSDPAAEQVLKPEKKATLRKENRRGVGKPAVAEPRNQTVQVKLTKSEIDGLKEKAGMVPISSFVHAKLKEYGII